MKIPLEILVDEKTGGVRVYYEDKGYITMDTSTMYAFPLGEVVARAIRHRSQTLTDIAHNVTNLLEASADQPPGSCTTEYWLEKQGTDMGRNFTGTEQRAFVEAKELAELWDWNVRIYERHPRRRIGWATPDKQTFTC